MEHVFNDTKAYTTISSNTNNYVLHIQKDSKGFIMSAQEQAMIEAYLKDHKVTEIKPLKEADGAPVAISLPEISGSMV